LSLPQATLLLLGRRLHHLHREVTVLKCRVSPSGDPEGETTQPVVRLGSGECQYRAMI